MEQQFPQIKPNSLKFTSSELDALTFHSFFETVRNHYENLNGDDAAFVIKRIYGSGPGEKMQLELLDHPPYLERDSMGYFTILNSQFPKGRTLYIQNVAHFEKKSQKSSEMESKRRLSREGFEILSHTSGDIDFGGGRNGSSAVGQYREGDRIVSCFVCSKRLSISRVAYTCKCFK